jgi:N-acetyl-anhydromuramyl-L-alanine amidase AmpD
VLTPDTCPQITTGRSPIVDARNSYMRPKGYNASQRRRQDITHIVIHILGTNWNGGFHRFINTQDAGVHYIIKQDGTITQFAPELAVAGHAGIFPFAKKLYERGDPDIWMRFVEVSTGAFVKYKGNVYFMKDFHKLAGEPIVPLEIQDGSHKSTFWERKDAIWEQFDYFKKKFPDLRQPYNWTYRGTSGALHPGDYNAYTFGIELAGGDGPHDPAISEGSYRGLDQLLTYLCAEYEIPRTSEFIIGHEDVNPIARWGWDPGRTFDWNRACPRSRYVFPLSGPKNPVAPVAEYVNNEDPSTGHGGTYTLGLGRTLHSGIHLFPASGTTNVPARCMAPGYIVAARLPAKDSAASAPAVLDMANNWTGFVLVRHEFEDAKHVQNGVKRVLTAYSLYMHLAPPDYANLETDPYLRPAVTSPEMPVPWFGALFKKRFGSWIRARADGGLAPGTVVWAREPFSSARTSYTGFDFPNTIVPEEGGRVMWIFRPPPAQYGKVIAALREGKVVTFPEPLFAIKNAGEAVGLLQPLSRAGVPQPAFLHWEVFAPVTQDASGKPASSLREILKLVEENVQELKGAFARNEIAEINENNFLEPNELRQKVLPVLTTAEKAKLEPGIAALERDGTNNAAYQDALESMLDDRAGFAPQPAHDGRQDFDQAFPNVFAYPLTLDVETDLLPSPDKNADTNRPYQFKIDYFSGTDQEPEGLILTDRVTVDAAKYASRELADPEDASRKILRLGLRAPAEARSLRVEMAPDNGTTHPAIRSGKDDGALLLKALLPHRWRRVLLSHFNEWSPQTVQKLFNELKNQLILPGTLNVDSMLPLAWWKDGDAAAVVRAFGTVLKMGLTDAGSPGGSPPQEESVVPVGSGAQSLFGTLSDQLPINGKIDNLHPVTLLWLLEILYKRSVLDARRSWEVSLFYPETKPPFAWGWLYESPPVLGDTVDYMIVTHDYGYDVHHQANVTVGIGGAKLPLYSGPYRMNGFILQQVPVDFWGHCTLSVEGAPGEPAKVLNSITLDIAAPQLDDATPSEKQAGEYRTMETSEAYVVPVKLKASASMPRQINGLVGIQLSRDAGKTWRHAQLFGERVFLPALATPTLSGETPPIISTEDFVIENDFVVGRTPKGRGNARVRVTNALGYEDLRLAQNSVGMRVSVSLALAVQKLRDQFKHRMDLREVERSGKRCVLSAFSTDSSVHLRLAELALSIFPKVRVSGETSSLTQQRLAVADATLKKQLVANGLEVSLDSLETKDALLAKPDCPPLRPLRFSADGLYIEGLEAAQNPKGEVTENFTFAAYANACALRVSLGLVRALDKLYRIATTRPKLSGIEWAGRACTIAGTEHAAAARDSHLFAEIGEDRVRKELLLVAAKPTTYFATIDARATLDALYAQEIGSGQTSFRFYFSPSNGLARVAVRHRDSRPYYLESELPTVPGGRPPAAPLVACEDAVGSLRPLAFGQLTIKLIGDKVHTCCQLTGNRMAWAPFRLKITQSVDGQPKPAVQLLEVHSGDELVHAQFLLPAQATRQVTYKIEAELKPGHPPVSYSPPASRTDAYSMTPALLGAAGSSGMKIEPLRDLLLVWCRCQGLEAPSEGNVTLEQARLGTIPKLAIASRSTAGRELVLEITPAGSPERHAITYLVASERGSGYPNHDGIFCAVTKRTGSFVAGTTYTFTIKRRNDAPVRGATVTPLTETYLHSD